jgi:hypothetical protein
MSFALVERVATLTAFAVFDESVEMYDFWGLSGNSAQVLTLL